MQNTLTTRRNPPSNETGLPIFIYGTLRTGQRNHDVMRLLLDKKHALLVDPAARAADTCIVNMGGLPALWRARFTQVPNPHVLGELYVVTPPGRALLDAFEGNPTFYRRERYMITSRLNLPRVAEVYHAPRVSPEHFGGDLSVGPVAMYKAPEDDHVSPFVCEWGRLSEPDLVLHGGYYWQGRISDVPRAARAGRAQRAARVADLQGIINNAF